MRLRGVKKYLLLNMAGLLVLGGMAVAQRPKENVSGARHPNIANAQRLAQEAWESISARSRQTSGIWKVTPKRPRTCWVRSTGS